MFGLMGVARMSGAGGAFSPLSLFANGEQGAWYDPSDFSSMFQDSAGTTPVTAVEQPVGRINDKSGNGNHATQATAAARPVVSARKNYLWEDLTGSIAGAGNWTKQSGVTVDSLGAGIYRINFSGDGQGVFASINGSNGISAVIGATYIGSVELATESGTGTVTLREPIGSQFADTDTSLTTAWLQVSTPSFVASSTDCGLWIAKKTGSISSVLVRFPQLELGSAATRYQRVTTATDYDTVGFPRYIANDGIDDLLATTFPDLGTDVTIARAVPFVGASILTAQTIGAGVRNDSTNHAGLVIIDRALTAGETAALTAYLNAKAGV